MFITLRQILILGGAFEQEGSGRKGGGERDASKNVRGNYMSVKGTNMTVVLIARRHPFKSPAWY